jgi:hypothetical protein
VLAWHHEHLSSQSHAKQKRYHKHESQQWLDFSEGLLDNQFEPLKAVVFEKLDSIAQASSLVELVNSFIRPSLKSSKGQITQETFHLIMFYHNHRRYKSGKRQGKAPIELLTGEALGGEEIHKAFYAGPAPPVIAAAAPPRPRNGGVLAPRRTAQAFRSAPAHSARSRRGGGGFPQARRRTPGGVRRLLLAATRAVRPTPAVRLRTKRVLTRHRRSALIPHHCPRGVLQRDGGRPRGRVNLDDTIRQRIQVATVDTGKGQERVETRQSCWSLRRQDVLLYGAVGDWSSHELVADRHGVGKLLSSARYREAVRKTEQATRERRAQRAACGLPAA